MRASLPSSAGVVIVGGGVIGLSAAFHLAEAGADVVLVERGALGSGSTSKAAGGVRAQFSDALNIAIAQRSLAAYKDFGRRPGWEIDLHEVGYLFVLTRTEDVAAFERGIALQNEHGVPSRLIGPDEAKALCPLLEVGDVLAAAYSPEDGHATPEAVVQGYASGARAHGARLLTGCEAHAIDVRGGEVAAVVTSEGTIRTGTVICAAGAWSRRGRRAGRRRAAGQRAAPRGHVHRADRRPAGAAAADDRLRVDAVLPPRGPGRAAGDGRSRAGAGDRRAAGAGAVARGHPRRLGRVLRHEPRPQRDPRRGAARLALPVRDRVLRPRLPAGSRRWASCCATSCCGGRRSPMSRRSASSASTAARWPGSSTSYDAAAAHARAGPVQRRAGGRRAARGDRRRAHPAGRAHQGDPGVADARRLARADPRRAAAARARRPGRADPEPRRRRARGARRRRARGLRAARLARLARAAQADARGAGAGEGARARARAPARLPSSGASRAMPRTPTCATRRRSSPPPASRACWPSSTA